MEYKVGDKITAKEDSFMTNSGDKWLTAGNTYKIITIDNYEYTIEIN